MHKATFLEGIIRFTIQPDGPILVKAGETGGADPTRPDMEFVRTGAHGGSASIYLPGPSLKGVIRAQAERICRTLDTSERNPDSDNPPLADNPIGNEGRYQRQNHAQYNTGRYVETHRKQWDQAAREGGPPATALIYRRSAYTARLFGHTAMAGRVRFADAYGVDVQTEERNGVAIDRIYGSVAVGPFNYETVVAGNFPTSIALKNVTLGQLGLLGLALRDLQQGRVAIGFGKSRGLGRIKVAIGQIELRYPTCELTNDGTLQLINKAASVPANRLAGLGAFCSGEQWAAYQLPTDDTEPMPAGIQYAAEEPLGVRLIAEGEAQVSALFSACVRAWRREISL